MRRGLAGLLFGMALFVLAGPVFGLYGIVIGMDINVRGGWVRGAIDVGAALLLVVASFFLSSGRSRTV